MTDHTEESSSQFRAERLLCLREMSGLSRDKIQHRYGIARGTLQNWESARFGGLTVKGAKAMLKAYLAEGIVCDLDWILHGIGSGPVYRKRDTLANIQKDKNTVSTGKLRVSPNESTDIAQEILYFRNTNPNAVDLMVQDDAMAPFINPGDYIAGIKMYQGAVEALIGKHCIVQTVEHGIMVRILQASSTLNRYSLQARNVFTHKQAYIADVEIMFAAEVIWQRSKAFKIPVQEHTPATQEAELVTA